MLTVEDLAFDGNRPQPPVAVPRTTAECSGELAGVGEVSGAAGGADGGGGIRRAARDQPRRGRAGDAWKRQGGRRELPAGTTAAAQNALGPPEPAEVDPERLRTQEIFEQVTTHLKREPTQSSRLLQSWIHSD